MSKRKREEYPLTIETFMPPSHELSNLARNRDPSAFNGMVQVVRYRVTAEVIDEPVDVITARIQHLWDHCDNYHQWDPLKRTAKRYGYELQGSPGSKRSHDD